MTTPGYRIRKIDAQFEGPTMQDVVEQMLTVLEDYGYDIDNIDSVGDLVEGVVELVNSEEVEELDESAVELLTTAVEMIESGELMQKPLPPPAPAKRPALTAEKLAALRKALERLNAMRRGQAK